MSTKIIAEDIITLTEAPTIPGLSFRRFRGEADYPNILAVINGSKEADDVERTDTLEEIANFYAHLNNCDPYEDMLFAEMDGEVIGYSRVWWQMEFNGDHIYSLLGFLLPAWRRKGIGTAMLCYNESRLREIASAHPNGTPKYFMVWASETEKSAEALFARERYKPVRYFFEMTRPIDKPLPDAPMPDGLEVRPVKPEDRRTIWEGMDEAFEDHWGHVPHTEEDYQRWMNDPINDPGLWKVAWDGDEVAGMVGNFVSEAENEEYNRKRGWTEDIWVRRPWRKRGLARSLIVQSIQMFKEMGMEETALGVDTENLSGALRLYEGVGYEPVKRITSYKKPLE